MPHYLEAGFFVLGCAALALVFDLTVKLGQKTGLVGPGALDAPCKADVFEDTSIPQLQRTPPIADPVAATPVLDRCHADEMSPRQTIAVPGRSCIVYWNDKRRD